MSRLLLNRSYSGLQLHGVRSRRVIIMERTTYLYSIHVQTAIVRVHNMRHRIYTRCKAPHANRWRRFISR
jgi:hypothetical protein